MKNTKVFFVLLYILFTTNINSQPKNFIIFGTLKNFPEGTKIKLRDSDNNIWVDSTIVASNKFQLLGHNDKIDYASAYYLKIEGSEQIVPLLLENGEQLELTIHGEDLNNRIIVGSKNQSSYEQLDSIFYKPYEQIVTYRYLSSIYEEIATQEANDKVIKAKKIIEISRENINDVIKNHPGNFIALYYISTYLNALEPDRNVVEKFLNSLDDKQRKTKYAQALSYYLKNNQPSLDISLFDESLKEFNLSKLSNKDYILLEIGSNYCGYSKEGQADLLTLKNKFKDNLDLITIHVDNDIEGLKNYADNNTYDWKFLFDLQGRYSEFFINFKVIGTPTYLLFNKNRELINRWENKNNWTKELNTILLN